MGYQRDKISLCFFVDVDCYDHITAMEMELAQKKMFQIIAAEKDNIGKHGEAWIEYTLDRLIPRWMFDSAALEADLAQIKEEEEQFFPPSISPWDQEARRIYAKYELAKYGPLELERIQDKVTIDHFNLEDIIQDNMLIIFTLNFAFAYSYFSLPADPEDWPFDFDLDKFINPNTPLVCSMSMPH